MDTAKVDIQKLQLLNDRINQTIDALNQVRLSVHGLQQTQVNPAIGAPAWQGLAHTSPYGWGGAPPLGAQPFPPQMGGYGPQFVPVPQQLGFGQVPQQLAYGLYGQVPQFGIGHTGVPFGAMSMDPWLQRQSIIDPYIVQRVAQTFPFVQYENLPIR